MAGENVLAIDNGTQSVRAMIFSPTGDLIAKKQVKIQAYVSPQPGWAEQDPDYFWKMVCEACQLLWKEPGANPDSIAAVALTTQRSTLINLDENGNPLRPAIQWLDQRVTNHYQPVKGLWGLAFDLIGMRGTVNYFQGQAECNWIIENQPEIWRRTHKYLLLSGYLTYRLVGEMVDSTACQVGYIPFDYKNLTWAKKGDWKWQALHGIRKEQLPDLIPPGEPLGLITQSASRETGIPEGIPLIASAADKATEVLGAGCLAPNIACLSYGTTATINTTHKKYIEVIPLIPPYPAAVPDTYSLEIQVYRGYWMIEWFKREFAASEQRLAKERGVVTEALFDELLAAVPPGSMGLTLQPYWSPGVKIPGPEAKGAVIGFGDVHTRAHFYRSIIEGLAYALREGAERTTKRSGVPITQLMIAGGGSQSKNAVQLTADVFGLPASTPHLYEASGLGAAINACVGAGLHPDYPAAIAAMTRPGNTYEPIPENHKIYTELYERVYLKMYKRLQPLYEEIRQITGYPSY